MSIPDYKTLIKKADQRLARAAQAQKIVIVYACLSLAAAAVTTCVQYYLGHEISQTGGLGNLGLRSALSSLSQFLPMVQALFLLLLDFGYMAAMVRVSRGQYSSPNTLRAGTDRFGPLIRCTVMKMLMYLGSAFIAFYTSLGLFFISPFSNRLNELLTPLVKNSSISGIQSLTADEATMAAITRATLPALVIFAIVGLILFLPLFYRLRMSNYVIYDHPEVGALFAIRESRNMMRNNRLALFKLDLHFWWYYLALGLISMTAYGDLLLGFAGITLPLSETVTFFLFYFISLALQFALLYYLRNKVETTYALAYDALCSPKEDRGVVLGNIFQM